MWQFGITEKFKQESAIIKFKKSEYGSRKTIYKAISIVPLRLCSLPK
jgi:hypothetical protein